MNVMLPKKNEEQMSDAAALAAQGALSIYAEQVVSRAVDKNNKNRSENAALQASRDLLLKVQVGLAGDVIWKGSIMECQEEEDVVDHGEPTDSGTKKGDDYFVLKVDGEESFPLDKIIWLSCTSSGQTAFPITHVLGHKEYSSVKQDGTVELRLKMGGCIFVVVSLENFVGTVEYMKKMIEDNRLCMHMSQIGTTIYTSTGEPVSLFVDENLEGATFRVTKIELAKTTFQPILDQDTMASDLAANDEDVKELKKLCNTFVVNPELRKTLEEQTSLLKEHILLKASRDMVRLVQVRFPGAEICVNLDQGRHAMIGDEQQRPSWLVSIPSNQGTVSLLDICKMQISLSSFLLTKSGWFIRFPQFATPRMNIVQLPYNNKVDLFFAFDKSWSDIDLDTVLGEHSLLSWLRVQLAGGNNEHIQYDIPTYDGPELFMKLVALNIRLDVVSRSLSALGIDFSPKEGSGDGGDEDSEDEDSGEE